MTKQQKEQKDPEERSAISMNCHQCGIEVGALDCPKEWRSLGDWLAEHRIVPLCTDCFNNLKEEAISEGRARHTL